MRKLHDAHFSPYKTLSGSHKYLSLGLNMFREAQMVHGTLAHIFKSSCGKKWAFCEVLSKIFLHGKHSFCCSIFILKGHHGGNKANKIVEKELKPPKLSSLHAPLWPYYLLYNIRPRTYLGHADFCIMGKIFFQEWQV